MLEASSHTCPASRLILPCQESEATCEADMQAYAGTGQYSAAGQQAADCVYIYIYTKSYLCMYICSYVNLRMCVLR